MQKITDKRFSFGLKTLIFLIIPLIFGGISLSLGKDINWDLLNYHYYNAYAFLEHRLDYDIAPAQLQTFYNPILDIPFYLMTKHFPAWVAGFVLGFAHGFNLSFVFLIFWKITNIPNKWSKFIYGIFLVCISSIAPGFISELGNTMHDNLTSLLILSAVFLLIIASEKISNGQHKSGLIRIGVAGLIMGLGVGLKPTMGIFAASSAFAFVAIQISWRNKLGSLIMYGAMGLTGGLASAGFWWWELWSRYRNPLFPYYNHIFKSPYIAPVPFIDNHFLPSHLWEYFIWPLLFSRDSYLVNPLQFFDIRFGLLYLVCLAWLLLAIAKPFFTKQPSIITNHKASFDLRSSNFLLLFFITTFVLWMIQFSNYRYIISLELLVPLCFLIVINRLTQSRNIQVFIVVSAVLMTLAFFTPFNWGRLDWSSSYFSVDTSQFSASENVLIVMLGRSPTAYVIPEFPRNYRFVRPESNLYAFVYSGGKIKDRGNTDQQILFITIKDLMEQQRDSFYVLYNKEEPNVQPKESLLRMGITPNIKECFLLKVNTPDILEMCRVVR